MADTKAIKTDWTAEEDTGASPRPEERGKEERTAEEIEADADQSSRSLRKLLARMGSR